MPSNIEKKNGQKKIIIVIVVILVLGIGGYFIFMNWQNQSQTIQTISTNVNSNGSAANSTPEPVKVPTLNKGKADNISIPDRNIETPVIYVTETDEEVFQDALANGVVQYPGSALPGELGNAYIFGHSSDFFWKPGGYKEVFKPLVDIPVDTVVKITDHEGELFIYKVIETKIVGPKDASVLDQYDYERKILTLQTSWPVGTALKRFIAICELDEVATYGEIE